MTFIISESEIKEIVKEYVKSKEYVKENEELNIEVVCGRKEKTIKVQTKEKKV